MARDLTRAGGWGGPPLSSDIKAQIYELSEAWSRWGWRDRKGNRDKHSRRREQHVQRPESGKTTMLLR